MSKKYLICLFLFSILLISCAETEQTEVASAEKINAFTELMQKHLDAVSNKDIETLESTLSPDGNMQLILPSTEVMHGTDAFIDWHREWFKDDNWTFETKILDAQVGKDLGLAVTEIIYREPERDGKPYFNRMTVSYVLSYQDGNWYVIKDHASSIEKSTD